MKKIMENSRGMLHLAVETVLPEAFFNACVQAGISPRRICRRTKQGLECDVTIGEYRRMEPVLQACQGSVQVRKRWGLPFLLRRLRGRWALLAGAILCLAGIWGSSLFLWDIQVTGNQTIPTETILRQLRQCGVGIGTFSPALQPRYLKHEMLLAMDDLSFFTMNIWGSRAYVEVRERTEPPELTDEDAPPSNLVANATGIITRILRDEGSLQVSPGQAVLEGELLVSGVMDVGEGGILFVRSAGEIYAETLRLVTARTPETVLTATETGRQAVRWWLIWGEQEIPLFHDGSAPFEYWEKTRETLQLSLGGALPLPVRLIREEYREVTLEERTLSQQEGSRLLEQAVQSTLEQRTNDGKVLEQIDSFSQGQGILQMESYARMEENIAREVTLPLPEEVPQETPEEEAP